MLFRLGVLDRLPFSLLLLHRALIQRGLKHLHRFSTVLVLASLLLTRYHNAGRVMSDADRRVRLVYVLSSGSGSAICINPQVRLVDLGRRPWASNGEIRTSR